MPDRAGSGTLLHPVARDASEKDPDRRGSGRGRAVGGLSGGAGLSPEEGAPRDPRRRAVGTPFFNAVLVARAVRQQWGMPGKGLLSCSW